VGREGVLAPRPAPPHTAGLRLKLMDFERCVFVMFLYVDVFFVFEYKIELTGGINMYQRSFMYLAIIN